MRCVGIFAAVLAVLAGSVAAAPAADPGQTGLFSVECKFSHRLSDDPIVFHHHPGRAHSHEFFANTSTDAHSTVGSMQSSGSTCHRPEDRSGYWIPTLYKYGRPVAASVITVYYSTGRRDPTSIQSIPDGLKMIAGDGKATEPQSPFVVNWDCGSPGALSNRALGRPTARKRLRRNRVKVKRLVRRRDVVKSAKRRTVRKALRRARRQLREARRDLAPAALPSCPPGRRIHLSLRFPDCWVGKRLDSRDHQSHMAYSPPINGPRSCPPSHPVPVPVITFSISWPVPDGEGVRLASGPVETMHGDVFSVWNPGTLESHVARCLRTDTHCQLR